MSNIPHHFLYVVIFPSFQYKQRIVTHLRRNDVGPSSLQSTRIIALTRRCSEETSWWYYTQELGLGISESAPSFDSILQL